MKRLSIIGGSSPFIVPLFEALAAAAASPLELVLQGRNETELALTAACAHARLRPLGWRILTTSDRRRALEGADIVLQQARFGGLAGRAEDERLALSFGIAPDETLGPAALQCILRMRRELLALGRDMAEICPNSFVLNLTNPLSIATSLLRAAGVRNVFGLCELPLETARAAAAVARVPADEVYWEYTGFNHRGFVVRIDSNGESLMPLFLQRLGDTTFSGASSADIIELSAIPTKYYSLLTGKVSQSGGRAAALISLRRQISDELSRDPGCYLASARQRGGSWYELAVAPTIAALCSDAPVMVVLNAVDDTLLTRELHCEVSRRGVCCLPPVRAAGEAQRLIERFEEHERAMIQVALAPSRINIMHALELDPLVPSPRVCNLADALSFAPGVIA